VDGRYRKIYFYHHRNKDGLIYREERIGRKTIEYYKNREDKLTYRSVTFNPDLAIMQGDLKINDNHIKRECVILKMTQLFSKDEDKAAE
jgi:hypothetical protein